MTKGETTTMKNQNMQNMTDSQYALTTGTAVRGRAMTTVRAVFWMLCLWCGAVYAGKPAEWDGRAFEALSTSMTIMARVHKDGEAVRKEGAWVAVFLNGELRGAVEFDDSYGYYWFYLDVYANSESESGYAFQYYDPDTDKVYDLRLPQENDPLKFIPETSEERYGSFTDDGGLIPFVLTLPTYAVTVENGTAEPARACVGDTVTVTAVAPGEHKVFMGWTGGDVVFADANAMTTSFTMPAKNVTVTAVFADEKEYDYTVVDGATP